MITMSKIWFLGFFGLKHGEYLSGLKWWLAFTFYLFQLRHKMSVEMFQKPSLSLNVYSKNISFLIHIPPIFFSFSNLSQDSSLINGRLILVEFCKCLENWVTVIVAVSSLFALESLGVSMSFTAG